MPRTEAESSRRVRAAARRVRQLTDMGLLESGLRSWGEGLRQTYRGRSGEGLIDLSISLRNRREIKLSKAKTRLAKLGGRS